MYEIYIIWKFVLTLQWDFKFYHLILFYEKKYELNEDEAELIEVIRNLRKAFPNGYDNQLWLARQIFDNLTDLP